MHRGTICIITHSFFRIDGTALQIGGVQTYVGALCDLFCHESFKIEVLQLANRPFSISLSDNVEIFGIAGGVGFLEKAYKEKRGRYVLTIFAFFNWADWASGEKCIAIQHGVASDGFYTRHTGIPALAHKVYNKYQMWNEKQKTLHILNNVSMVICVDLNFPNWLRASFPFHRWEEKLKYVPNFGDPISEDELNKKFNRNVKDPFVLISRRFEVFRGVLMMAKIVNEIVNDFPNVNFQFSGTGSQDKQLRALLAGRNNCKVFEIPYHEMQKAYFDSDIVVVPTLWSEGTSLSCIEGMCSGSAVLATNVGGLSNLIFNEFNGLIVEPTYDSLKKGLVRLIKDPVLRRKLGKNSHLIARECFSRERWEGQIQQVILQILEL